MDSLVTHMLSGESMMDYSTASNSLFFDLESTPGRSGSQTGSALT